MNLSSLTKEYLYIGVTGAQGTETVEVAVIAGLVPDTGDWEAAAWQSITPYGADARILVGAGGDIVLTAGVRHVWIRVTGVSERPVLYAGKITVT